MLDTLLLKPSLHFTQLHFTPLHYTCQHFTSTHLNFTQLHFTTFSFGLTRFKFPTAPFHLTSLYCTFSWFLPHLYSFHFTLFIIAFLTLFLKILYLRLCRFNFVVCWSYFIFGILSHFHVQGMFEGKKCKIYHYTSLQVEVMQWGRA
jgi:hypothetical protein